MGRTARTLFFASLLLPSIGVFGQQASFSYDPPSDFYSRTSMDDCVQRFYSEPEEFHSSVYTHSRVYRGEFQHMVAIGWIQPNGKIDYLCGGSLLTDDFVLTTAQCVLDNDTFVPNTVRVGDTDIGSEQDDEYAQQIGIRRIIVHPQYRRPIKYFDIALIQLTDPVRHSEVVCPACLWREPLLPPERMDTIGIDRYNFEPATTLMRIEVEKLEPSSCDDLIGQTYNGHWQLPDGLRDDLFCVVMDFKDSYNTDGTIGVKRLTVGGFVVPLVVGIISFGIGGSEKWVEVYTKTSSYIDWIEQEVNQTLTGEECLKNLSCLPSRNLRTVDFTKHNPLQRFGLIWNDTAPSLEECGATLIDYQYLLTSASCVTTDRGDPKYVSYDGKEHIAVEDVYVSPSYIRGRPQNDVALVKIAKFANPKVHRPSCLWNRRKDGEWSALPAVSAYGPSDSSEGVHRTISIIPVDSKDCRAERFRGSDLIRCYNRVQKVPPLCSVDNGGPVTNDKYKPEDPNYIYGVVSSLNEDCMSKLVITDVTPHIVWIEDIIISGRYIFSDTKH